MRKATAELDIIPVKTFQKCYQQWQHRWEKCVNSQGECFEGDLLKFVKYTQFFSLFPKVGYFMNPPRILYIGLHTQNESGIMNVIHNFLVTLTHFGENWLIFAQ